MRSPERRGSAAGRGKKFLDAIYQKLGTVEIDDQAAGVQELCKRPYVDCSRVGIMGTSYGGYASALAILRHPEVFRAAAASSPVTDWRHYDTIYTERYMWIPQENAAGYDAGSAMTYADKLKGGLMLYYGSADNNVHPNNSMQLIAALQKAGKSFEVQVGPDRGHSSMSLDRMMEFIIENLVLTDLLAWAGAAPGRPSVLHWRTTNGAEVDFVVELPGRLLPIEVKASRRVAHGDARHLRTFLQEYPAAPGALLLYDGAEVFWIDRGVLAAPWHRVI